MSQTNEKPAQAQVRKPFPKLVIRNKPGTEGRVTTGANVSIELDGQKIPMLSFLKFELKPTKVAKVTMEMYVELDAEVVIEDLKTVDSEQTDFNINNRVVEIRTLSNLSPTAIGIKKV